MPFVKFPKHANYVGKQIFFNKQHHKFCYFFYNLQIDAYAAFRHYAVINSAMV